MSILDGYGGGPDYSPASTQSLRPSHMNEEFAYQMPGSDELLMLLNRLRTDALATIRASSAICQEELDEHMVEDISADQEIEEIWTERWVDAAEVVALGREILTQTDNHKVAARGHWQTFAEARQTITHIQDTWNDIVGAVQVSYAQQLVHRPESIKTYRTQVLALKQFRTLVEEQLDSDQLPTKGALHTAVTNINKSAHDVSHNSEDTDLAELVDCTRRLCSALEICGQTEAACRKIEGTVVSSLGRLRNKARELDIEV